MNKARVPKGGDVTEITRRCRSEKVLYTIFVDVRVLCYRNHERQEEHHRGVLRDCVLSELNKYYKKARLLHTIAPAHNSKLVQGDLSKKNIQTLPHPPYSPDLFSVST